MKRRAHSDQNDELLRPYAKKRKFIYPNPAPCTVDSVYSNGDACNPTLKPRVRVRDFNDKKLRRCRALHQSLPMQLSAATVEIPEVRKAVRLCENIRKQLYGAIKAIQWPFVFSEFTDKHVLRHEPFPPIYKSTTLKFTTGPCCRSFNGKAVPIITSRVLKKTTQGKVFIGNLKVNDVTVSIAIKANEVTSCSWIYSGEKSTYVSGVSGDHLVVSSSFIDALCYVLVSNLVETRKSPHFPVCYGANAAPIQAGEVGNGEVHQIIWIEYLPYSMYYILRKEKRIDAWYSAVFQAAAGMAVCFEEYGIISNDLHCQNIRARNVSHDTWLYYVTENQVYLRVPTFGKIYCIIDFGRSLVRPWKKEKALLSSEFEKGFCVGLIPDNQSYDMVRLVMSLSDNMTCLLECDKRKMYILFNQICQSDDGTDVLQMLTETTTEKFNYHLETLPRRICNSATPQKILSMLCKLYQVGSVPDGVHVYPIPNLRL